MIEISTNVAIGAGSMIACAGFMIGYAIAWRQGRSGPAHDVGGSYLLGGPFDLDELAALRENAEDRVRRSQA